MFFPLFLPPYHVEMIQCYHLLHELALSRLGSAVLFCVAVFCFVFVGLLLVLVFGFLFCLVVTS